MRPTFPPGGRNSSQARRQGGAALIIVLAFVVLLTGLMVAYFTRSMAGRQLSNSSAGQTKAAILAQSASDIVIAGLKKEIAGGSTATLVGPVGAQSNVYVPLAPVNAVPVRFPTPAPSPSPAVDLIPNLVRRSMTGDGPGGANPLPSPAEPSLASNVNSANDATVNGRKITPARWNSHYLIPRASTAADTDSTPDTNVKFTPPDWVLVSRSGPAVRTAVNDGTHVLNDPTSTNTNYVVGRYAYAIYDEGGLLDMNVAGHPTPGSPAVPTSVPPITPPVPFTATQISQKGSLALADLTQLPTVQNPTSTDPAVDPSEHLTQAVIDEIVGWRNYASASPAGPFPNFTFTPAQASQWFTNFAFSNVTGFLNVYGGPANFTGATDQALLSRQQLLRLRNSINGTTSPPPFPAAVLQYMGTFSRSLEQPSYAPNPNRPKIVSTSLDASPNPPETPSVTPPNPTLADSYMGNNDAVGGDDVINPSFLTVRVPAGSSFTRYNGIQAVPGEPLVKTKFALSRLALVTYTSTAPQTTGGNHIWDYFGLSRSDATQPWTYYHGGTHIMTLSEIASAGREPDFAELLKAAINVGSLGKAGPHLHNDWGNYQYGIDVSVDLHVLQIMADLIDQYDTDSFPTVIQMNVQGPAGSVTRTVRGIEDLPYFYRYHSMSVVSRLPSTVTLPSDTVTFYNYNPGNPPTFRSGIAATLPYCKAATLADGGEGVMLYVPEIWNPHDATPLTGGSPPGQRPTNFRVSAVTDDPIGAASFSTWSHAIMDQGATYPNTTQGVSSIPDTTAATYPSPLHQAMTIPNTAMDFNDNGGQLFREPTMLWHPTAPTGANLHADSGTSLAGPYTDANSGVSYMGLCVGKTPLNFAQAFSNYVVADPSDPTGQTNLPRTTTFIFQPKIVKHGTDFPPAGPGYDQMTFRMEYQDPASSKWIIYDEKYADFHQEADPVWVINKNDPSNNNWINSGWANPVRSQQLAATATAYDPRTSRFGVGTSNTFNPVYGLSNSYLYEAGPATYFNDTSVAGNVNFGKSNYTIMETERPTSAIGNVVNYSNPGMTSDPGRNLQMRWAAGVGYSSSNGQDASPNEYDGLFAQNNPAVGFPSHNKSATTHLYYEDADGTARRAMGAYVDTLKFGSDAAGTATSGAPFGLPEMQSNTYPAGSNGVGTPNVFNLNRPLMLNRPFQNVAEMGYAFRGIPWKQLDFFTPESGDTALLDVFCLNEPPASAIVAGKVNLNTHQKPVIQAVVAGAYRDELKNLNNLGTVNYSSYIQGALDGTEASNVAAKLVGMTTDTTNAWHGPFTNVGNLVGRLIPAPGNTAGFTDFYSFTELGGTQYTYAGLSAALDNTVYSTTTNAKNFTPKIQRMRESAIRALADNGQTRVWNLLIDVVAQSGRYSPNAVKLSDLSVDGEQRCWVHIAIDRLTGEVIDKQVEIVSE